jgi:Protein of unknown function (DUF2905)
MRSRAARGNGQVTIEARAPVCNAIGMPVGDLGRLLIVLGLVVAALGGLLLLAGQVPWLGRLPGDISFQRGNVQLYIPLATSIVVSVLLTLLLNLFLRR